MTTILNGDCLKIMKSLESKSIDCFICDLPYGQLTRQYTEKELEDYTSRYKGIYRMGTCKWDIKIDIKEFWIQVKRLCKDDHTPVLMFCNTKFGIDLINSNPDWFRYDLVWNKEVGVNFVSANKMPMKSHEMIYVFSKKGAYYKRINVMTDKGGYNRGNSGTYIHNQTGSTIIRNTPAVADGLRCPLSVINIPKNSKRGGHPTEKPEALYEWLLSRYCPEGGKILDPTAGSFNSIKVAKRLGLKAIGIEKDRDFFNKAISYFH